jgi:hypothetical protein
MAKTDLSVQAILTANTTPFANGMKQATTAAKKFSGDMKQIRKEINQPLYVPQMAQQKTGMVTLGGYTEGFAKSRFEMIRKSEEKALKLRQFYARKNAELDAGTGGFRLPGGVFKKALGSAGLAGGMIGESFGDTGAGRIGSAIGNIGGAGAMGFLAGGPWGAAIFGGVSALKEFKIAVESATKSQREAVEWAKKQQDFAKDTQRQITQNVRQRAIALLHPDRPETLDNVRADVVLRAQQLGRQINELRVTDPAREPLKRERAGLRDVRDRLDNLIGARNISEQVGRFIGEQIGRVTGGISMAGEQVGGPVAGLLGRGAAFNAETATLVARMRMLVGQPNTLGSPLAMRGTNEYLQSISDQPKAEQDLEAIAKTAREQLAEEKKQTAALEKAAIAAQEQITVNM